MTQLGINGLDTGFVYDVRVRGIFDGQAGPWSPTYEIDIFSDTSGGTLDKAPDPVSNLNVTPTIDSFIITWEAPLYNNDGTVLKDMKDYVVEVSDVTFGSADATYIVPEHNKPIDLLPVDRKHQFEFTYKMNRELYGGAATPTLYVRVYARDTTNNESNTVTDSATNTEPTPPGTPSLSPFAGGIGVSWTAGGADTVEYVLRAHTASMADPPSTGTEIYRGTVLNFSHITTGTKYYRVGAVDIFGQTNWSSEASATAGSGITYSTPNPPTSLVDSWVGANYRVSWTASTTPAVTDIDRYRIEITSNSVTKTFWTSGVFYDIDPQRGKDFGAAWPYTPTLINVYAVGPSGLISSALAKSSSFASAPSTPTAPTLSSTLSTGGIAVTWSAPTDPNAIIDQIEIYAGTSASPTTMAYAGKGTTFTYSISPLFNGTYYFRSRVRDVFGRTSSYSADDNEPVTTVGAPTSLSMSSALDPADATNRTSLVSVNFTTPNSIAYGGSKVRYRIGAGLWTEVDLGGIGGPNTAVTHNLRNLVPNTTYRVEVICYDFKGTLGNGGSWTLADGDGDILTATDSTAPSAPTSATLTTGATSLMVKWTNPTNADFINGNGRAEIQIATNAGFSTGLVTKTQPGGLASAVSTEAFTGLTPATTYWARVRAVDATGNPTTDTGWVATTPASISVGGVGEDNSDGSVPATSPAATLVAGIDSLHVLWDAVGNNDPLEYEVHLSTTNGFTPTPLGATMVGRIAGTYMAITTDGAGSPLAYSTNYYVRLIARDADGPSGSIGTQAGPVQIAQVNTADIATNAITAIKITADSIIADKIDAGAVDTTHINATGINADRINIGGNASNMVPVEWADFELTSTMYDGGGATRPAFVGTPTLVQTSATQVKFGARALAVTVDAASEGIYFNTSATTYNIPILANKTYIVSAYVRTTNTGTATLRYKPSGGADTNLTFTGGGSNATVANTWTRVWGWFTNGGTDTTINLSILFSAISGIQYIDGVMMEEKVGTLNAPSGFVKPGTVIDGGQIVTGTLTADKITSGTLDATNINVTNLDASGIEAGTINTGSLQVSGNGANLIPLEYYGFEYDVAWYTGKFNTTTATATVVTNATTDTYGGTQCLRIVTSSATNYTRFADSATTYNIPSIASTSYIVSMWVKVASGSSTARIVIKASNGTEVAAGSTFTATTSWVRYSAVLATPAATTGFHVAIKDYALNGGTMYVDGVMVERQIGSGTSPTLTVPPPSTRIDGSGIHTGTLDADRLKADSAIITDLTVGTAANAPGHLTVVGTAGYIESDNYNGTTLGWRLSQAGLDINQGDIEAGTITAGTISADRIAAGALSTNKLSVGGDGKNIAPLESADFENDSEFYENSYYWMDSGSIYSVSTEGGSQFKSQSLDCFFGAASSASRIWLAPTETTYNIPVEASTTYIFSAYFKSSSVTGVRMIWKGNAPTALTGTAVTSITGSWSRKTITFITTTDTAVQIGFDTPTGSVASPLYVDGVQLEKKYGNNNTATPWTAPTATTIDGSGITARSIKADRLKVGTITAEEINAEAIEADKLAAELILASKIKTATAGKRVEFDNKGIRAYDGAGNQPVNIPTDGTPSTFKGQIEADSLIVNGNTVLSGTNNELTKSSVTTLTSIQQPPTQPPVLSVVNSYEDMPNSLTYDITSTGWRRQGLEYDENAGAGGTTDVFWTTATDSSDSLQLLELKANDRTVNRTPASAVTTGYFGEDSSVARLGSYIYVLYKRDPSSEYKVRRYLVSTLALDATYTPVLGGSGHATSAVLASDGTNLYITYTTESREVRWNLYNATLVKQGLTVFTGYTLASGVKFVDMAVGDFDFGSKRILVSVGTENTLVRSFNASGTQITDDNFNAVAHLGSHYGGLTYANVVTGSNTGSRFWSFGSTGEFVAHSNWKWTSSDSNLYWVAYAWYRVSGTLITAYGPRANITMQKRKRLSVTSAAFPTGSGEIPNRIRVFMDRGASDPGPTAAYWQQPPGNINGTNTLLDTLDTDSGAWTNTGTFGGTGSTPAIIKTAGATGVDSTGTGETWSLDGVATDGFADIQVFTTPGSDTWNKPKSGGLSTVEVIAIGGGGGGGGGRRTTSGGGNPAGGGGGGGGGSVARAVFPINSFASSETVVVGAGANGGAGRTGSEGAGTDGGTITNSNGSSMTVNGVSGIINASRGLPGAGGTTTGGLGGGGAGGTTFGGARGMAGGDGAIGAGATQQDSIPSILANEARLGAASGGGGAGVSAAGNVGAGVNGGDCYNLAGGAAGTGPGVVPGNGTSATTGLPIGGAGGGGASGRKDTAAAQNGGNGGIYGGGGGGGGGGQTVDGGNGGSGAQGIVVVICR